MNENVNYRLIKEAFVQIEILANRVEDLEEKLIRNEDYVLADPNDSCPMKVTITERKKGKAQAYE
jgi:hypothetical protein